MSNKLDRLDAPGIRIEGQHLHLMRREVANLMRRQQLGFPGAQPVSFSLKHMEELRTSDYYVCEKTDGIRYLMYLAADKEGNEIQYLIDRKNDYWLVPPGALHLPRADDEASYHVKTLVDGELVFDNIAPTANGSDAPPAEPQLQPTFLVFDCMVLGGKDLTERSLDKRLGYFKESVYKPYDALFRKYPQEKQFQAFSIQMKDMQYSYGIEMMFRTILPQLRHGNDGLIFTRCDTPYHPGTDQHILKWKPAEENTVDFKIQLHFPMVDASEFDFGDDDDEIKDEAANDDDEMAIDGHANGNSNGNGTRNGHTNGNGNGNGHRAEQYPDYDALPTAELYAYYGNNTSEPYQLFAPMHLTEDEWELMKSTNDPISNRIVECGLDDQQRWRIHRFRDDKLDGNHISTIRSVMESIRDSVSEQELKDAAKGFKDGWRARRQGQK